MARKGKWAPGGVYEIQLQDDSRCYAVVIEEPLMAFSLGNYSARPSTFESVFAEIAFRVWVHGSAIARGAWPRVASIDLPAEVCESPTFYRFDPLSGRFYLYVDACSDPEISLEQARGLESAAVWERAHIESRLYDAKRGLENRFVESLRAENQRVVHQRRPGHNNAVEPTG